jgi:hypothetical protein
LLSENSTPLPDIETLTGNVGGIVGPDGANNVNVVGTGSITVTGNPGTNTLTISEAAGDIATITGDSGGAVGPDGAANINLLGATGGISVTGNPGTNTLVPQDLRNITKYVVDPVGGETEYTTIQSAINAANAAGIPATIFVRPGNYTENLTLYDKIDVVGAVGVGDTAALRIIGTHIPPLSGAITLRNLRLESATDIFNSAVAGTSAIILMDNQIAVTNGYVFNLPNWTGAFVYFDEGSASTNDGVVNNTAGATVFMTDATIGAGSANTMTISGNAVFFNIHFQCPLNIQGSGTVTINGGCWLDYTVTTAGSVNLNINNSILSTGANTAISHSSTTSLNISDVTIDSSANPIVNGTGTIEFGDVTYLTAKNIGTGITQTYSASVGRVTPYVVGPAGNFSTIQAALDAASSTGISQTIYVQPGTYTENLTLYNQMYLVADSDGATIVGTHVPPVSGIISFDGFNLNSATDIFNSIAVGSTTIQVFRCFITVTDGYLFRLLNWTGLLIIDDCGDGSTTNGIINNTSSANLKFINTEIGAGLARPMVMSGSGNIRLDTMNINCPMNLNGSGNLIIQNGCKFSETVTIGGSVSGTIINSSFLTGATTALFMNSSNNIKMGDVTVDSSASPAVDGTGLGTLEVGSITFLSDSNFAGTLTIAGKAVSTGTSKASVRVETPGITFDGGTNVLSFYETGTWTPTLEFGGATTGITYGGRFGNYVRIGDLVQFSSFIILSNKGTAVGTASITGLPYICASGAVAANEWQHITIPLNYTYCTSFVNGGTTSILLLQNGNNVSQISTTNVQFANNSVYNITGTYRIT